GLAVLAAPLADPDAERISALAAALALAAANRASARMGAGLPSGWRNVPSQPQRKVLRSVRATHEVEYRITRGGLVTGFVDDVALDSATPSRVVLTVGGLRRSFEIACYSAPTGPAAVHVDSPLGPCAFDVVPRFVDPSEVAEAGSLLAPMPGTVIRLGAGEGDTVTAGQPLLWLEAMKMEHTVAAPADGVVTALHVDAGRQVEVGEVLAVVGDPAETQRTDTPDTAQQAGDSA